MCYAGPGEKLYLFCATLLSTGLYSIFVWCVAVICQHFDLKLLADIQDNLEMNPNTPLHEDTLNNLPPETPHQETQRCTRNSPCRLAGCTICPTPTNHVRNLDEELGTDDTNSTIPTTSDLPPTPPNHPILILSNAFKIAIKEN